MYTKLRPRPKGPGRVAVARNQRVRLYGAMIEAVNTHGYSGTTVTELTALAGISRRTFYEQFDNKEACFLRTYDLIVERTVSRVAKAWRNEQDWITRLRSSFEAFAQEVVEQPKASRLATVEALAAGPAGVARVERTSLVFERMILAGFASAPDGIALTPIAVKGIVGGTARVVRKRLLEEDVERLPELVDELLAWALQYRSMAAFDLPTVAPPRSAGHGSRSAGEAWRGGGQGAQEIAARGRMQHGDREGEERARILQAAARIAARAGHAQLTVGLIVQEAEVREETFLNHFESSDECFMAAVDMLATRALALAIDASLEGEDWRESVYLGIGALMRHVAEDPIFARVAFVEVFATGVAGFDRRARLMHAFTEFFAARAPSRVSPRRRWSRRSWERSGRSAITMW